METPETFLLARVPWQLFVTLTWAGRKSESMRHRILFAWLRKLAEWNGIHFHRVLWLLREERGEVAGREHFHILIGGLPERALKLGLLHSIKNQWKKEGGGWARVSPYTHGLAGVQYVLKGDSETSSHGGSHYEALKFGTASKGTASKSVVLLLHHHAGSIETGTLCPALGKAA